MMPTSDAVASKDLGVLIVRGAAGVLIEVVDTAYRLAGRGTVELHLELPAGIYMVNWLSGGEVTQKVVKLRAGPQPLMVVSQESGTAGTADAPAHSGADGVREQVAETVGAVLPSLRKYGAEIAFVVLAEDAATARAAGAGMRLLRFRGTAQRAKESDLESWHGDAALALSLYRVRAGHFILRMAAPTGETIDQTVAAMEGRRTFVVVRAALENVLVAEQERFTTSKLPGIDPAQTVIFSMPTAGFPEDLNEAGRLASILLHDIMTGGSSLGADLVRILDSATADPFLRLYAAVLVLARLDSDSSPAIDDPWPAEIGAQAAFRARWAAKAGAWLKAIGRGGPPDVRIAAWRLRRHGIDLAAERRLTRPPMLEQSWRWASEHSLDDPASVPMNSALRAAARSAYGSPPWLCWHAAAAKAQMMPLMEESAGGLRSPDGGRLGSGHEVESLLRHVTERLRSLLLMAGSHGRTAESPLSMLSPELRATALVAFEALASAGDESAGGVSPAGRFASILGMPTPQLQRRLQRMLEQLDRGGEGRGPDGAALEGRAVGTPAPALARPVRVPDDPNKGRFGGRSTRAGFRLHAAFRQAGTDWVTTELTVTSTRSLPEGAEVEFHLHDSFRPPVVTGRFNGAVARTRVTSWGGFTVGAWIPSRGVELELDLARLRSAPKIIRTR